MIGRPKYVVRDEGPDHAKHFFAEVFFGDESFGEGEGGSKKLAEQGAAWVAWTRLSESADSARAGAEPHTLTRLLRVLAHLDLVAADGDRWAATDLGVLLRGGHPSGLRDLVLMQTWLPSLAAWQNLEDAVRTGHGAYELYLIGGVRVGIAICEDVWSPTGPMSAQAAGGAELILDLNASPYSAGRVDERVRMLATRAADASCGLVYVNQVGGQDELVFDGRSMVFDADGTVHAAAPQFEETVMICDVEVPAGFRKRLLDPREVGVDRRIARDGGG